MGSDASGAMGRKGESGRSRGAPPSCESFVNALVREVGETRKEVEGRFGGLDPAQLSWSPKPGRWGVGELLGHLLVTNGLYLTGLRSGLDALQTRERRPEVPVRGTLLGRSFARMVGPDAPLRLPAPPSFRPRTEADGGDTSSSSSPVSAFLAQQDEILELLERARGLPLDEATIPSPATRFLRFRLTDAFRIVVAHQWRHVHQAHRVVAEPGFPQ